MANGAADATSQAARVSEIGFAEFTTTLVREVFKALVASHLEQMQAHIALTEAVAGTIAQYLVKTKNTVTEDEARVTLAVAAAIEDFSAGIDLSADQATAINGALETPADANVTDNNQVAAAGNNLDDAAINPLIEAAKIKIAANRFILLEQMVRQGALRLGVDHGTIETRLTFTTYGRTSHLKTTKDKSTHNEAVGAGAILGGGFGFGGFLPFGGGGVGAGGVGGAGVTSTSLTVNTVTERSRDVTGTRAQIYGRVRINFKTDYAPLNQA